MQMADYFYEPMNGGLLKSKDWLQGFGDLNLLHPTTTVTSDYAHHREKYDCTADLLFDQFGFNQISKADANSR